MIDNKYINIIISLLMVCAVLITGIAIIMPDKLGINITSVSAAPEYENKLFNKDEVIEINIDIEESNWNWIIENALQEEYRTANVTINGQTYYNVGLRPKGNSSLRTVAMNENTNRFSFKIKFNEYINGQTCYGLEQIALNNMISDATYMKEYLSYQLFDMMSVPTPLYSYAYITINGEPWGLYLMVESDAESYLDRNFGINHGVLYKPERNGSSLKWMGEDWSNYSGIRENAMVDITDSDFEKVIEMIKNLNSGTDIEKYIDVDTTLRYFAVNTILVNLDSYAGNSQHNYFLYEKGGVFSILPWDLNMSFGGFQMKSAQEAINFSIDAPYTGNAEDFPLISKLLEIPEYKKIYYKYLDEAIKLYFDSGIFEDTINKLDKLIEDYVKNDPTAFVTYEEYKKSLPVLIQFGKLRAASVTAQLSGQTFSEKIDLDLSALGSMPGRNDRGNIPNGMRPNQVNRDNVPGGIVFGQGKRNNRPDGIMPNQNNKNNVQDRMGSDQSGQGNRNNMPGGMVPNQGNKDNMQDGMIPGQGNRGNLPNDVMAGQGNRNNMPNRMMPEMAGQPNQDQGALRQRNFPGREIMPPEQMGNNPFPQDPQMLIRYGITTGLYILIMIIAIIFVAKFKRKK